MVSYHHGPQKRGFLRGTGSFQNYTAFGALGFVRLATNEPTVRWSQFLRAVLRCLFNTKGEAVPPKPIVYGLVLFLLLAVVKYFVSIISITGAVADNNITTYMPAFISVIVLIASLWVIQSKKYTPTDRHWAYGALGTIVGYWLHKS